MLPTLPSRSIDALQTPSRALIGHLAPSYASQSFPRSRRHLSMATAYTTPFRLRRTCPPGTRIASVRRLSRSSSHDYPPTKESQDKDSLNPVSTEYSKSGGDAAAATTKTAFDPNQTSPETQQKSAEAESRNVNRRRNVNPLNVSPGNKEVTQTKDAQNVEGSTSETDGRAQRNRTSGAGSAPKSGGGNYGGGG